VVAVYIAGPALHPLDLTPLVGVAVVWAMVTRMLRSDD
jgi:hypothetical protein